MSQKVDFLFFRKMIGVVDQQTYYEIVALNSFFWLFAFKNES